MQFAYVKDLVSRDDRIHGGTGRGGRSVSMSAIRARCRNWKWSARSRRAAGKTPEIVRISRDRILEAGGNPMGEPAYFGNLLRPASDHRGHRQGDPGVEDPPDFVRRGFERDLQAGICATIATAI